MTLEKSHYIDLIIKGLKEDLLDTGDVTSEPIFNDEQGSFKLISKDTGILCGSAVFTEVFKQIDKNTNINFYFADRDILNKNDIVAEVSGKIVSILKGERTALNFISHLSGIATKTNKFVNEAKGALKILDTRKTLPGYRILQKYAVFCGGGTNHRIGLYDMVMIKDNHIDAAGSITNAINKIRQKWNNKYKIEVETRNLNEVQEALDCNADRIMLDNMDINTMKQAVKLINKKAEIEISGNMNFDKIKTVRDINIDYISFGELTHTIKVYDFSLKMNK